MTKITQRQNLIIVFIRERGEVGNKEIKEYLQEKIGQLNRVTIIRDLEVLKSQNLIKQTGRGRNIKYKENIENKLLIFFDPEGYFNVPIDQRTLLSERFNFEVFNYFNNNLFSKKEFGELDKLNADYQKRRGNLSPVILKKEFERLTIELSWKSSQIEGNTYSLIDTEILIKENREAKGHTKEEAQMILNHKKALDYILNKKSEFRKITLGKVENIHNLIVEGMGIEKNIRKGLVGITGTKYRPLENEFQIKEALEKMILIMNKKEIHPLIKSLASVLLISYIQPFEDGNKRTARLLGNAILLVNNYCPLSYRSVDENDYKKATLLFYEQNSVRFFKKLFIGQFKFALENYFLI